MLFLHRVEGAECPRCGCAQSTPAGRAMKWGQEWERRECAHCGTRFTAAPAERPDDADGEMAEGGGVEYLTTRCPRCGGASKVYSSKKPIRYHVCTECGARFKSVERE